MKKQMESLLKQKANALNEIEIIEGAIKILQSGCLHSESFGESSFKRDYETPCYSVFKCELCGAVKYL